MLNNRHQQKGVTLVESMIALLVISVGLLGIAALQITAMRQNTSALNHSQAVWFAYNMADRIRSNGVVFDNYNGVDTNTEYTQSCLSDPCNNEEMIDADAADWGTMLTALPAGRGMITAVDDGLRVTIMWDDEGTGATGTDCGNNPETDLTCYSLVVGQ